MEMICCHHWHKARFLTEAALPEEHLGMITGIIRPWLTELAYDQEKTGLYLGTTNAGVAESVEFWRNALVSTPKFANPLHFNWTLSNGPASFLSRELLIKGPCYTMVGGSSAMEACFHHASADLNARVVTNALLIGLDLVGNELRTGFCLWSPGPGGVALDLVRIRSLELREKHASAALELIADCQIKS